MTETREACPLCGTLTTAADFPETDPDLPEHLAALFADSAPVLDIRQRASVRHLCDECHHYSIYGEDLLIDDLADRLVRETVPKILELLGGSPWTSWLTNFDATNLTDEELLELLRTGRRLPPQDVITAVYDGWPNVLRVAGFGDVPLPSSRGRRSIANDGHACFSEGERLLDDWFAANGVPHDREPIYPGSNFRGDFLVNGKMVEYFGMHEVPEYKERMELKAKVASVAGVEVVPVFPKDLNVSAWGRTQERLAAALGFDIATRRSSPLQTSDGQDFLPQPLPPVIPSWFTPVGYEVAPGFYTDPLDESRRRWNDGQAWSYRVMEGTEVRSNTPTVDDSTRAWAEAKFRPRKREGGVIAAGERWLEETDEWIETLPEVASGDPDQDLLARIAAVMDLVENSNLLPNTSPHMLAARYFGAFRMRGAELAAHRRHADHVGGLIPRSLYGRGHTEIGLVRRSHAPDLVAARFALRGIAPTGSPEGVGSGRSDDLAASVLALLRLLGIAGAHRGSAPGEEDRILVGELDIRMHSGPLNSGDVERLATLPHVYSSSRILFINGDVSQEARDSASAEYIALIRLSPSELPMALNWDANSFFDDYCDDESIWMTDPEFWEHN